MENFRNISKIDECDIILTEEKIAFLEAKNSRLQTVWNKQLTTVWQTMVLTGKGLITLFIVSDQHLIRRTMASVG